MAHTESSEIPDYAAWVFESGFGMDRPLEVGFEPPADPPRRLSDLPIFGAFWAADGADLNR